MRLSPRMPLEERVYEIVWYRLRRQVASWILTKPSSCISRVHASVVSAHGLEFVSEPAPLLKRHTDGLDKLLCGFVAMEMGIRCSGEKVVEGVSEFCSCIRLRLPEDGSGQYTMYAYRETVSPLGHGPGGGSARGTLRAGSCTLEYWQGRLSCHPLGGIPVKPSAALISTFPPGIVCLLVGDSHSGFRCTCLAGGEGPHKDSR